MNEIQLRSDSPRCFCGELKVDFREHLKRRHAELVVYHYLIQMEKFWNINPLNEILKASGFPQNIV